MIIICHNCQSRYKVRDEIVADGPKKARCKNCGAEMVIYPPEAGAPVADEIMTRPAVAEPPTSTTAATGEVAGEADREAPAAADQATEMPAVPPGVEETSRQDTSDEPESGEEAGRDEESAEPESPEAAAENAMAKLEKRRREMEDEIAGRLHKAALETLEFGDLELLGNKIKGIESNPENVFDEDVQLFACIKCKDVFALYPDDPRQCPNCPGETPLIRGQDILRQFGMFNR